MATASEWIEGARLRTLPAAIAPVAAASGITVAGHGFGWLRALLALVVALALQVGVNYANDYSDGIRGTDDERVGPLRLVGSGAASPRSVKIAAFACFGLAGVSGLLLVALSGHWWLLLLGIASVLAAWYYTGGSHPYGYAGWGEVFVFVFFGLVAVAGTVYTQTGRVPVSAWLLACAVGGLACAILVANNLRDVHTDIASGKRTLATRLGEQGTRTFYALVVAASLLLLVVVAALTTWWALLSLAGAVFLVPAARDILRGASGRALIPVLKRTGLGELAVAVTLLLGCLIGVA